MLLVSLVIDIIAVLIPLLAVKLILLLLSVILFFFTLYFFRDPKRKIPAVSDSFILSPADGKVMMIEEIEENKFLKSKARLIGIFLSPLNVHVNRFPVSGKIDYFNYVKGEYIVAFDHKSSERNERTEIGISTGRYKLMFKQIAGFVARRIVCQLRQGDTAKAGEKFGMIKFGSRVDVIIPFDSSVKVSVNQKVVGGETILAEVTA
jgi:phosphatidylserine decarboxylase